MRQKTLTWEPAALDADGISVAQTKAAAGALTITGALASGGVATLDIPRHVSVYGGGDNSAVVFTITGTNRYGDTLTEDITGGNNATVKGVKNFKTVTAVASDAATDGNVTVGSADEFETQLVPVNLYATNVSSHAILSSGASLEHRVQFTMDDILGGGKTEDTAAFEEAYAWSSNESEAVTSSGAISALRLQARSFVSGTIRQNIICPGNAMS